VKVTHTAPPPREQPIAEPWSLPVVAFCHRCKGQLLPVEGPFGWGCYCPSCLHDPAVQRMNLEYTFQSEYQA